jgi:hypothetical protein
VAVTILRVEVVGKKFTAFKFPGRCPLVLLVKVGCKQVEAFGSEEGKVMGSDSWKYGEQGRSWARGGEFCVWRAAV